jgi:hypothetical protein
MMSLGTYIASSVSDSGTAVYTFDLAAPATISVWLRVLAPDVSQDSFYLSVDGGQEATFRLVGGWSSSFFWTQGTNFTSSGPVAWTPQLSAGRHTLRVRGREPNTGLDALAISNSSWRPY